MEINTKQIASIIIGLILIGLIIYIQVFILNDRASPQELCFQAFQQYETKSITAINDYPTCEVAYQNGTTVNLTIITVVG